MRANRRLAELWLDAVTTELGASGGTIDTYTDDLNCYLVWPAQIPDRRGTRLARSHFRSISHAPVAEAALCPVDCRDGGAPGNSSYAVLSR